jgi:2-polyprenyl-3-methyl-5-hydroxy-6-metoxy-1,4-benzoquinol methylase
MITEDAVYLDEQRKLSQSHRLAIDFIQQRFSQEQPSNILEIGVGSGSVGKALREMFPQVTIDAVDKTDIYLDTSKSYYDNLYYLAIEDFSSDKRYDIIILLDVLEHLENPWQVLKSLKEKFLSPQGYCIIS